MACLPRAGRVEWIGLRHARGATPHETDTAIAIAGKGLVGDRYAGGSGKRGVTLVRPNNLPVIAALSGHAAVAPTLLRVPCGRWHP